MVRQLPRGREAAPQPGLCRQFSANCWIIWMLVEQMADPMEVCAQLAPQMVICALDAQLQPADVRPDVRPMLHILYHPLRKVVSELAMLRGEAGASAEHLRAGGCQNAFVEHANMILFWLGDHLKKQGEENGDVADLVRRLATDVRSLIGQFRAEHRISRAVDDDHIDHYIDRILLAKVAAIHEALGEAVPEEVLGARRGQQAARPSGPQGLLQAEAPFRDAFRSQREAEERGDEPSSPVDSESSDVSRPASDDHGTDLEGFIDNAPELNCFGFVRSGRDDGYDQHGLHPAARAHCGRVMVANWQHQARRILRQQPPPELPRGSS
mmetsp:Transcript_91736/g.248932  ORF Transcript_91736/g.248932 Transcript_91736/m.248932 type:complete len:325 (+) Transcript_91736:3-977(+)